jgi:hypothetical protein
MAAMQKLFAEIGAEARTETFADLRAVSRAEVFAEKP